MDGSHPNHWALDAYGVKSISYILSVQSAPAGTYYRVIQQYMIDMENLLQLLDTSGKVTDAPTAKDLVLSRGDVVFNEVSFAYDPAMAVLKSVSVC
jgi:ABC-type transport system involved in Fe-S cluster assembly fused permease/ATPase subunit